MGQVQDPRIGYRFEPRVSRQDVPLQVFTLKAAKDARGDLIGFEAWAGSDFVGIVLYDDDLRITMADAGFR